eukprot:5854833-Pyramimonas_sp.AAC.1
MIDSLRKVEPRKLFVLKFASLRFEPRIDQFEKPADVRRVPTTIIKYCLKFKILDQNVRAWTECVDKSKKVGAKGGLQIAAFPSRPFQESVRVIYIASAYIT